jgi:hypothetical protein
MKNATRLPKTLPGRLRCEPMIALVSIPTTTASRKMDQSKVG